MIKKLFEQIKNIPLWAVPLYGVVVLIISYTFEYGFGYLPCQLCLWQRFPWFGIAIIGSIILIYPHTAKYLLKLCVLIMIISLGLAGFNTGIEYGFWTGLDGCSSNTELVTQTSALLNSLENEAVIRCDEPVWTLFGISMAGYNALLSLDALILFYLMDKK